jgi:hypothetical protein
MAISEGSYLIVRQTIARSKNLSRSKTKIKGKINNSRRGSGTELIEAGAAAEHIFTVGAARPSQRFRAIAQSGSAVSNQPT